MGGYDDESHLSRVEMLDTELRLSQWHHAASLPQPLSHALPAIIGNVLSLGWLH